MEADHTPNEFPFSAAGGAELLAVPLSYATSSDGRQVVFTMSAAPGQPQGDGSGSVPTPHLQLMTDPGGLLESLKNEALVSVDAFDGFAAHSETVAAAARATTVYQPGHEMPSNAELAHAVTELQLQQYETAEEPLDVQHEHQHDNHQQEKQGKEQHQQEEPQQPKPCFASHSSLVEVINRPNEAVCFICDTSSSANLVELFGEANILAASKTPLCMKLESLLGCTLPAETVHSDVICVTCLGVLETLDGVECHIQEMETRCRDLSRRVRRRFTRTVRAHNITYNGWQPETDLPAESASEMGAKPGLCAGVEAGGDVLGDSGGGGGGQTGEGAGDAGARKVDGADGEEWMEEAVESVPGSPPPPDLSDPDDPDYTEEPPTKPRKAKGAAAGVSKRKQSRKQRGATKARCKVEVDDPRRPGRTKFRYIYDDEFHCEICGKAFAWRGHLVKHMQTHTGERPLSCEICGQTFRWTSHLTDHLRRHKNEKPFICSICGKSFVSGNVFKGHMRTHTDEKPYMCGVCGKQFRDSSNLRKHEWVHSDKRPHRCEPCNRGFLTTSALKVHNRTAHGENAAKGKKKGSAVNTVG
ncbi:zinc finger protein with KRAB and SCAN domains 1-like [Amphibalanus amphitrite]|uniref:zinc finger protein with KRAB and SCAN domains 1-like n=1 Tax=Amphibalanus amphitrite TaxID=1232801 RepID=UPI001C915C15|nr:zinc finger protein with KRAB and SCAN domains 1-like [Amphibalanus amphitrite]XP_043206543.1 zinc finger protein with KRAB and SCAN domains 1-like [Amphibalanus amphitrite]